MWRTRRRTTRTPSRARTPTCRCYLNLFETFGGWCNAVKRLFYQMKDKVRNKLSKRQHEDEASWSTRSWLSLQAQRMSVALQLAAAEEIATELRLAAASEDAAVA